MAIDGPAVGDRVAVRRAETRRTAIDAAWGLAREHGLAAFTLRDLAARLGLRAPSLYEYFSGKHAIYDAMFADGNRELAAAMATPPLPGAGEDDVRTALVEATRRFIGFCSADATRFQLLFQHTVPGWQPSPDAYAEAVANYGMMTDRLAAYGMMTDRLAACGIEDQGAVDLWTALLSGLAHQQVANDPGGDRWERLAEPAVDMYLTSIEKGARR
jgi:AcrR family transcriptional regulator